jgi:hypothetical protein
MNIIDGPINTPLKKFKNLIEKKNEKKNFKLVIISHIEYLKKSEMKRLDFLFRVTEKSFEYGNIVVLILWDLDVYDFGMKNKNETYLDNDDDAISNDDNDDNDNDKSNDNNDNNNGNIYVSNKIENNKYDLRDLLGQEWSKVYMYIYICIYIHINIHMFFYICIYMYI